MSAGGLVRAGGLVTSGQVRALAAELVTDELVVLPVRHHSPACALQVRRVIAERRPSLVLVEGPRGFTSMIPLLTHPDAKMPLAVYTYAIQAAGSSSDDDQRWAGYYPFCDYSPELVALRDAASQGIPARFIDLDLAEQRLTETTGHEEPDEDASLLDERHYRHSEGLRLLADRLGCHDDEDLWELLFEADAGTTSTMEYVERVTAYCLLARHDHGAAELIADGTAAREAEMVWHIRESLRQRAPGDGPILVVLGGFHAVVLPALLADPPPRPQFDAKGITADSALIRYSFERLERLNGYTAGMTSPGWHQHLWERLIDQRTGGPSDPGPREAALLTALLDISGDLRIHHKLPLPVSSVAAAFEQALQLAALRDRPAPLRSDLLDAVTSCFVKGDIDVEGLRIRAACRRTLTGEAIGIVPPGAGTPPLVHDAFERLRRQRLKVDALDRQSTSLDIYRSPAHRETSRLLHGLLLLDVPFASRVAGPDFVNGSGLGRLQERWEYHWSPVSEGALVEASVFGSTVPAAVAAKFEEVLTAHRRSSRRADAAGAVSLLSQACVLGLHHQVPTALALARETLAADASFPGVATAVSRLALLWEAREPLEARLIGELPALLRTAYERVIYLGHELTTSEAAEIVQALVQLRELLVGEAGRDLDAELYWGLIEQVRTQYDGPLVRGAAVGLLYSAGRLASAELVAAVSGHLSGGVPPGDAVGFLAGLLTTAREAAWQEHELLAGLDRRLTGWDSETFVGHLPDLRLAFADLTPVETDRVAQAVAALHGLADLGSLTQRSVTAPDVDRHLEVAGQVAQLLEQDGLGAWSGA